MHTVSTLLPTGTLQSVALSTGTYTIYQILEATFTSGIPARVLSKNGSTPNTFEVDRVAYTQDQDITVDKDFTINITARTSGAN